MLRIRTTDILVPSIQVSCFRQKKLRATLSPRNYFQKVEPKAGKPSRRPSKHQNWPPKTPAAASAPPPREVRYHKMMALSMGNTQIVAMLKWWSTITFGYTLCSNRSTHHNYPKIRYRVDAKHGGNELEYKPFVRLCFLYNTSVMPPTP